jgi:hypothetical protein
VTIDVDADGTPAHESSREFSSDTAEPSRQIFNQRPNAAPNAPSRGFAGLFDAIVSNIEQVIHGKTEAVELAIMCMLAEGHLLIEDVPGVGKTSLAKALSASVECTWKRVQFTPDLLPTDLVGVSVYQRSTESTVRRPKRSRHSSKQWRNARSPSMARAVPSLPRSW